MSGNISEEQCTKDAAIAFSPIGYIRSEHRVPKETPVQPVYASGCRGKAEILPEYEEGLIDLEGFSHIFIFYHFHQAKPPMLTMTPYLQDRPHGIFAIRGPHRPNPLGFSLVRLVKRVGTTLFLEDVDMLDGTPILDIKPFVARFDNREHTHDGWQEQVTEVNAQTRGKRDYKRTT